MIRGEQMLYANPALLRIYGWPRCRRCARCGARPPCPGRARRRPRAPPPPGGRRVRARGTGRACATASTARRSACASRHWRVDWDGGAAEQVIVTDETVRHDATAALLHRTTHDEADRPAQPQRAAGAPARAAPPTPASRCCCSTSTASSSSTGRTALRSATRCCARWRRGWPTRCAAREAETMRLGEDEFALLAPTDDPETRRPCAGAAGARAARAAARPAGAGVLPRRVDGRLAAPGPWPRRRGAAARRQRRDARGQKERAGHLAAVRRGALRARLGRHAAGRAGLARRPARRAVQPRLPAQGRGAQRGAPPVLVGFGRWCAGIIRSAAACRRSNSCPPPNAPAWSARSARSSSSVPARSWRAGVPTTATACRWR